MHFFTKCFHHYLIDDASFDYRYYYNESFHLACITIKDVETIKYMYGIVITQEY